MAVQLQKYLCQCGVGSRRDCEALIAAGRVAVNGAVVTPGARVDPHTDRVELDGRPVTPQQDVYILLNKPHGVVSSTTDDDARHQGVRESIIDFAPQVATRLLPAGRLDKDEEGAIIMTNDGTLAHRLASPEHGIERVYIVSVRGDVDDAVIEQLRQGVVMGNGVTVRAQALVLRSGVGTSLLRVRFWESQGKSLRRLFAAAGNRVLELKSVAIGPVHLGNLEPGEWRYLTEDEVLGLKRQLGIAAPNREAM